MTDEREWVEGYLREHGRNVPDDLDEVDYHEARIIDSLDMVDMILAAEERFGFSFDRDAFQDRRFTTVDGLAEIIGEHRG